MAVTTLGRVWRKPDAYRKSRAGRKPMDAVVMFKTLVLGALYTLSIAGRTGPHLSRRNLQHTASRTLHAAKPALNSGTHGKIEVATN
jgi:hypothetical protein